MLHSSARIGAVLLAALKAMRGGGPFDPAAATRQLLAPTSPAGWVDLVGPPVAGVVIGFGVAAYPAARPRLAPPPKPNAEGAPPG